VPNKRPPTSGSKTALIRVGREADNIHVEVQDHAGNVAGAVAEVHPKGLVVGIRGMRERVRQVHGELLASPNRLEQGFPLLFQQRHLRLRDRRDSHLAR